MGNDFIKSDRYFSLEHYITRGFENLIVTSEPSLYWGC